MTSSVKLRLAEPGRRAVRKARTAARAGRRFGHRTRRRAERARLLAMMLTARLRDVPVFLLVSGTERFSAAMVRRLRVAAGRRAGLQVLVLDFAPHATAAKAALAKLPIDLHVKRFWLDAAPGGGGCTPRHSTDGLVRRPVPGPKDTWHTGYYRDGYPVVGVTEHPGATMVDHYEAGLPAQRDEIDSSGRVIRIVDLHPDTGHEVTHRYLDSSGDCWLSVWVESDGTLGRTQRHRGKVREFPSFRAAQADWVRELAPGSTPPRLLASGSSAREVVELVTADFAGRGKEPSVNS